MTAIGPISAGEARLIRRCPLDQIMAFALYVVNVKTAKAIGITIPQSLLLRAEVI
jgi:hypothetical protein